jgi:predicted permease
MSLSIRESFNIARLRWRALIHRRRLERDLQEELEFHLAARAERNLDRGMDENQAVRSARRNFGNVTLWKETCREMWTFYWMETLWQDLRYGLRTLRKSPGFTSVAVLTLALGIGANAAIFSVVNAVLLRSLPYRDPERLVELIGNVKRARVERRGTSMADYIDWRDQSRSFEAMALYAGENVTLTGADEPERMAAEYVGQAYFSILGIDAAVGRTFRPEEDQVPQRNPVVILGDGLWKRRFGADRGVIGRAVQLNGEPYTIVGVMPPSFRGVEDNADLWIPLMMALRPQDLMDRGTRGPTVLARLKPGISPAQAQAEMDSICRRLERAYPASNEARGVEIAPLESEVLGDLHTPLLVLLTAVAFVLLIACTNVANLLLARSEARQREMAMRIALGAGRARVLHQLTIESLILVFAGAAAGLLLARFGVRALLAASPIDLPGYIHPALDGRVVLFTAVVSCAAALALGFAPAFQVRAGNLSDAFKQASSHAADSRSGRRFRNALMVAEVAFAMLLLVGAGLLIRTLQQLARIRPGYDPSHVLALRVSLPRIAGPEGEADKRVVVSARDILEHVSRIPGVRSASVGSDVPLAGGGAIFYTAEGQPPVNATNMPRAYLHRVSPEFFRTLGIPLLHGRTFNESESQTDLGFVVVSQALVKRFWPGQNPVGKRIKGGGPTSKGPWMTIVGVVNDMKYRGLPNNPTADPDIFLPFSQRQRGFALLVRTSGDPASLAGAVRSAVRQTDRTAVMFGLSTMDEMMARETARSRFTGWLMAIFAGAALLLAIIGIYGVMSYSVSRRTQEIGIRVAMGAARSDVLRLIVGRGMLLIGAGLLIGGAAAIVLTRLIAALLYGVTARDLFSFVVAAMVLAMAALAACIVPAARATRIQPAAALRSE